MARVLDAAHGLLDLQVVDRDAKPVGKVDDVELDNRGQGAPVVRAILVGAPALGDRLGGRFGAWYKGVFRRLHQDKNAQPVRIPFDRIRAVNSKVDLTISQDDLDIGRLERWLVEHLIGRIPGADHAPPQ
ncbi:MAG: PRC-barrel domain-containing protein [Actinomycetota bacterium]